MLQGGEPVCALKSTGTRALMQCAIFSAREIKRRLRRDNEIGCCRIGASKLPRRRVRHRIHTGVARDEIHRPCALTLKANRWVHVSGGKVTARSPAPAAEIELSIRLESAG